MIDEMTKGMRERERLRPQRIENYAVKHEAGFACSKDGCEVGHSVLVTRVDGELTTRCQKHLEGEVTPGQWNAR